MNQRDDVNTELREGVLWLTLNRPEVLNALNASMLDAIERGIDDAEADAAVRCIVITGVGKAFCAGADLSTVPLNQHELQVFLRRASGTMRKVAGASKPVIACLNGLTLAGGLELALCADLVVAAKSAKIGDGHIKYGLLPGAGGAARLTRAIGGRRAKYLLFTGARLDAAQLESWGLVQQVFDDLVLNEETAKLARGIAKRSPSALKHLKRLALQAEDLVLSESLALEASANLAHANGPDMREGLAAFAEKREPLF